MDTKEEILKTALSLFNRDGASSVTTRHIAAEMKISPGNLYYHFRNREEIVRVLLQRMYEDFNAVFSPIPSPVDINYGAMQLLDKPVAVMFRYRFFYMEPVVLLQKDPLLKKIYFDMKKNRSRDFMKIFKFLAAAGIMKDITDEDFTAAFDNTWALNEFIIQSMYMNNEKITEANMKKNFIRIMYLLKPFVTEPYREKYFPG